VEAVMLRLHSHYSVILYVLCGTFVAILGVNTIWLFRLERSLEVIGRRIKTPSLSGEQEALLSSIELRVSDEGASPKSVAEADSLSHELASLMDSMDVATQESILPRLLRLRWAVKAAQALQLAKSPSQSQATDAVEQLKALVEEEPSGIAPILHERVSNVLKESEERLDQEQRKADIEAAHQALVGNGDLATSLRALDKYRDDKEAKALLSKLQEKLLAKSYAEKLSLLRQTLERSQKLGNERLRQAGLFRVHDATIGVLLDLQAEQGDTSEIVAKTKALIDECAKLNDEAARQQQQSNAVKLREYQKWALEQIRRFDNDGGWHYDAALKQIEADLNRFGKAKEDTQWILLAEFPATKEVVKQKLELDLDHCVEGKLTVEEQRSIYKTAATTLGWKYSVNTELAYMATREGLIKFLLPINVSLLDPPVAQLYQRAFTKGWDKLEGRHDQLAVAEAASVAIKKPIE
jgi:hypothetical protein